MWELTRGSNYSSGAASQQVVALHVGSGALTFNALKLTIFYFNINKPETKLLHIHVQFNETEYR